MKLRNNPLCIVISLKQGYQNYTFLFFGKFRGSLLITLSSTIL